MILFPAIDLLDGKVVRLRRGEKSEVDIYSDDPVAVAQDFAERGADWVHVVDLSASFEEDEDARATDLAAIRGICATGMHVDAGGGVRSLERIEELVEAGAERIALGTALVRDHDFAQSAVQNFGEALVADVGSREGKVTVNGWREDTEFSAEEFVGQLAEMGFHHLVFTDVIRDGMQTGIDVEAYGRIAAAAGFPVIASGGIASLDDIRALTVLGPDVIEGAIVGRALYEGTFLLQDAIKAVQQEEAASSC